MDLNGKNFPRMPLVKGISLLYQTIFTPHQDTILPEVKFTGEGFQYHIYYPKGKALSTVIFIYGMSILGEEDTRLISLAHACTNTGIRVIIPELPGLKKFTVEEEDISRLKSVLREIVEHTSGKIELLGFSTGGSYSLLLAAESDFANSINHVVLFSPIYDVRDVFLRLHNSLPETTTSDSSMDIILWAQFVIAFRNHENLNLPKNIYSTLILLLTEYEYYPLKAKKRFYQEHIAGYRLATRQDLFNEGEVLDRLSARGHLSGVECSVSILHDAADLLVPPQHSQAMHDELAMRGKGYKQELLITPWLSHVVIKNPGKPAELLQIMAFLSRLFEEEQTALPEKA